MIAAIGAVEARIEGDARSLALSPIRANPESENVEQRDPGMVDGFKQMIQTVNHQARIASEKMEAVDAGRSDDLVGAMLASQQASLSFTMLVQVRNKIVGAMDELIKLQL